MNEASRAVQLLPGPEDTLTQSIYVDDRALAVSNPELAVKAIDLWSSWSCRLGLKENLNKMQIVCKQWSQKQTMISLGINEKHFVSSTRILGLDFVGDSSTPCPTEQRRKAVALRILPRLQVLPMSKTFKEFLYRTRCQTIISWGCWMTGHNPDFDRSWITQLKRVLGAHRMASRALWTLLQGHWVSPLLTANIACVSHFIRSLNFWHSRQVFVHRGAWVSRVRDILQKADFEQISFGHFRHPTWGDHQFCNEFWKQTSKNVAHQLRETWRKNLFDSFLAHSRRDSRTLNAAGVVYNEKRVALTRRLYFSASSDQRAVLTGAANSNAVYQKIQAGQVTNHCPWCNGATVADWNHVCWERPCFSSDRPRRPHDPLADRLGWSIGSNSEAKHLIHYMADVRNRNRILAGYRIGHH